MHTLGPFGLVPSASFILYSLPTLIGAFGLVPVVKEDKAGLDHPASSDSFIISSSIVFVTPVASGSPHSLASPANDQIAVGLKF